MLWCKCVFPSPVFRWDTRHNVKTWKYLYVYMHVMCTLQSKWLVSVWNAVDRADLTRKLLTSFEKSPTQTVMVELVVKAADSKVKIYWKNDVFVIKPLLFVVFEACNWELWIILVFGLLVTKHLEALLDLWGHHLLCPEYLCPRWLLRLFE